MVPADDFVYELLVYEIASDLQPIQLRRVLLDNVPFLVTHEDQQQFYELLVLHYPVLR